MYFDVAFNIINMKARTCTWTWLWLAETMFFILLRNFVYISLLSPLFRRSAFIHRATTHTEKITNWSLQQYPIAWNILLCVAIHFVTTKEVGLVPPPSLICQTRGASVGPFISPAAALWPLAAVWLVCVGGLWWFGRFLLYVITGVRFGVGGNWWGWSFLLLCSLPPFPHTLCGV